MAIPGLFFLCFHLFKTDLIQLMVKKFAMTEFKLRISGVGCDRSTN